MYGTIEALRKHARLAPLIAAGLFIVACKNEPIQAAPAPPPSSMAGPVARDSLENSPAAAARATPPGTLTPRPAAASPPAGTRAAGPPTASSPPPVAARGMGAAMRTREPVPLATATATTPVAAGAATPPAPARTLRVTDRDPIHDPTSPAYRTLQKPSEALREMPLDRAGRVNWVEAMRQGLVAPRASLRGPGTMEVLDLDILMTDTRAMPHVLFPHRAHTQWLGCDSCHPEPFIAGSDANPINMDAIFLGRYCGVCHDKVAFSSFVCERCHSVPHAGSPARWW